MKKTTLFSAITLLLVLITVNEVSAQKFIPATLEEKVLYEVDCAGNILFIIKKDNVLKLLNKDQQPLSDNQYDFIKILKKEMLYGKRNKTPILINCFGEEITDGEYNEITVYYNEDLENRFFVTDHQGKIGLIDGDGNILIPPVYDSIDPMSQHKYLFAKLGEEKVFFDYNGKKIPFDKLGEYTGG